MNKALFWSGLGFFALELGIAGIALLSQVSISKNSAIGIGLIGLNLIAAIFMLIGALSEQD